MFDREVGYRRHSAEGIPAEAIARFKAFRESLAGRSTIPWAEHCVECALPDCFSQCEYYSPRPDLKCRRFAGGIVSISPNGDASFELMDITFKKWGRLLAPAEAGTVPLEIANARESRDRVIAKLVQHAPLPYGGKAFAMRRVYHWKAATLGRNAPARPDAFAVEVFNPGKETVGLQVVMRPKADNIKSFFQKQFSAAPDYNLFLIPAAEIEAVIGRPDLLDIDVSPGNDTKNTRLVFGILDFVALRKNPQPAAAALGAQEPRPKVKCVVWDLDNTVWAGTLIEDGLENLKLNPEAIAAIHEFDRRGILQSVVSKNNPDDALEALKHFGIDEYFLYPQISWNPKSGGVKAIAKTLNIGIDTLAVIDDQVFERAEIAATCPEVESIGPESLRGLLAGERTTVPVTEESAKRRLLYREEMTRTTAEQAAEGNYTEFLRGCRLEVTLASLTESNRERVHELTQRTNQMNFSGGRYSRQRIDEIVADPNQEPFVISCTDRFGDYGIIGFALVDKRRARMLDLMFSCRIQRKMVDVSSVRRIVELYAARGHKTFEVVYRRTKKNEPNTQLFGELGLTIAGKEDDAEILAVDTAKLPPDDGVVTVRLAP